MGLLVLADSDSDGRCSPPPVAQARGVESRLSSVPAYDMDAEEKRRTTQ